MRISNQNQRTQVASDKTDEASTTGQVPKGAQKTKTDGAGIRGDSFEIAKSPSAFDQLISRNGPAPFRGQGVDLPLTDPNNAADSIRHDDPAVNPSLDGSDPRGDLERVTLERETIVDVAGSMPAGHTLEQSLPTGLDGKPLPTGPHHLGMDQAEKDLDARSDSSNSPRNMQRDPLAAGKGPGSSGSQQGGGWGDGRAKSENAGGGFGGGAESKSGTTKRTPPPGEKLNFNAPNRDLISDRQNSTAGELKGLFGGKAPEKAKEDPAEKFKRESGQDNKAQKDFDEWKKKTAPDGGTKMTDPDADPGAGTGAGTLTEDEVARMVAVGRGDIDYVRGYGGGPVIEGDKPPVRYGDLVTDPIGDDPVDVSAGTGTGIVTPPGQEISKTINPKDGLGSERPPSQGPGAGGGGAGNPIDG